MGSVLLLALLLRMRSRTRQPVVVLATPEPLRDSPIS